MKIDRLLGILTVLLQREKVTAPELAIKFEVSRRTIHRDIDDICKAGIPIITYQGGDGGISIAEGFKLDKSVLSRDELQSILTGLKSLESVSESKGIERLISKLSPPNNNIVAIRESILIDLSSHYKSSLSEKISQIRMAISENKLFSFEYYSEKGLSKRIIEPYFIVFKWSAWYVYGFCRDKTDFRLFKLNRLWKYGILNETFEPKPKYNISPDFDKYFMDTNEVTILFDKSVEFKLIDEYGPDCFEVTDDNLLKLTTGYTNKDYIIGWILSFGDKARVISPDKIIMELKEKTKNILKNYEHDT
jgi:predicted DNA-binding transcriptional regulator YafY